METLIDFMGEKEDLGEREREGVENSSVYLSFILDRDKRVEYHIRYKSINLLY